MHPALRRLRTHVFAVDRLNSYLRLLTVIIRRCYGAQRTACLDAAFACRMAAIVYNHPMYRSKSNVEVYCPVVLEQLMKGGCR